MSSISTALSRRWTQLCRSQQLMRRAAAKGSGSISMEALKCKIPNGVREKLEWAFCKAFGAVFDYGDWLIDKTIDSKGEKRRFMEKELNFIVDGSSAALGAIESSGIKSDGLCMLLTTAEGVGLGLLGVGIPDIVLFVTMLLRGVREAAAQYGRPIESIDDELLMLYILEAAMLSGDEWLEKDELVEKMLVNSDYIPKRPEAFDSQIERTAAVFATDLLVMKFIQGIPIVGMIGGLSNPFYYRKVLRYARLKYERAYIRSAMNSLEEE